MTLRPDLVLVKLPPPKDATKVELIGVELDTWLAQKGIDEFQRVLKVQHAANPVARVVQVGKQTSDVWPGDVVLLEPDAGEYLDIEDASGRAWPHLLVRERDITAVLERTE